MTYDPTKAEATATHVASAFPCQGVRVRPHPTVDNWVLVYRLAHRPFALPASVALDKMKQWRNEQRLARKGKRHGTRT